MNDTHQCCGTSHRAVAMKSDGALYRLQPFKQLHLQLSCNYSAPPADERKKEEVLITGGEEEETSSE